MNHEQLVIIQKKAAVFFLRHEKTTEQDLMEKTTEYLEREINWELSLARALVRDRGRDRAWGIVDFLIVELGDFVPTLNNPDQFILDSLSDTVSLEMGSYHNDCGTTHCRAGFIKLQAGNVGETLVKYFDDWLTGAMLYKKATGAVPNFFARNEEAMESIREGAANWKPVK